MNRHSTLPGSLLDSPIVDLEHSPVLVRRPHCQQERVISGRACPVEEYESWKSDRKSTTRKCSSSGSSTHTAVDVLRKVDAPIDVASAPAVRLEWTLCEELGRPARAQWR